MHQSATHFDQDEIELRAIPYQSAKSSGGHDSLAVVHAVLQDEQDLFQVPVARQLFGGKVLEHRDRAGQTVIGVRPVRRTFSSLLLLLPRRRRRGFGKMADHGDRVSAGYQGFRHGTEHVKMTFAAEREDRQYVVTGLCSHATTVLRGEH